VQRLLGEVEIAQKADERGEHAARLRPVERLHRLAHSSGRLFDHLRHAQNVLVP
jgi:hypothetical protein